MNIWFVSEPRCSTFAYFSRLGSWKPYDAERGLCPKCTSPRTAERIPPLVIQWEPGSDALGDFTWALGAPEVVITARVTDLLLSEFQGFKPSRVVMQQDPEITQGRRRSKQSEPRVWLPYDGPPLRELWVTRHLNADRSRSTVREALNCACCGRINYEVRGVESRSSRFDQQKKQLVEVHVPRVPGQGIYVHEGDLGGADFFEVVEFPDRVLCTDRAKRFIEEQRFTNVAFLEVGDMI
jgi:hypothetical protein